MGLPPTFKSTLGTVYVWGRNRLPTPATGMIARMEDYKYNKCSYIKDSKVMGERKELCSFSRCIDGARTRALLVRFLDSRSAFQYYACKSRAA